MVIKTQLFNYHIMKQTFLGNLNDICSSQINPLDLAAAYNQIPVLDALLDYGLGLFTFLFKSKLSAVCLLFCLQTTFQSMRNT